MDYFGIDERILNNSFYENSPNNNSKRSLGKLRDNSLRRKNKNDKNNENINKNGNNKTLPIPLRRNLSHKKIERPPTTVIRREVTALWNEALRDERNRIREKSPDRVSRITTLSNLPAPAQVSTNNSGNPNTNRRYVEPQSFGKRTDINLNFTVPIPVEKKKGNIFRNSKGDRRKIFSKTWWENVPIGAYLFFFGFIIFPLWFIGAAFQFRKENTVEEEIKRTKSTKSKNTISTNGSGSNKKGEKSTSKKNIAWKDEQDTKISIGNDKDEKNTGEISLDLSKMNIDPESRESWNWGLGVGGAEPSTINVNFLSGIEEYEKHKLAENEKLWRKINIVMTIICLIFIFGILIIYRKSIFNKDNEVN